jgi:hypothetical protein
MLLVAEIDQRVEIGHRLDDDVAAAAAIPAVGAAEFDVFFTAEGAGAGTAVTAFHEDLGFVEEFHVLKTKKGNGEPFPL